jgi:hypothetical protein
VVRAVAASLIAGTLLALAYLAYDVALTRGAQLPGGDLRILAVALVVAGTLLVGTVVTWLIVPLPRGSGISATRTGWSAALGVVAAVPVASLVLVVAVQIIKPLLV